MDDTPVWPGAPAVVAAESGAEYPGVLAAINDEFVVIEVTGRVPPFRPGVAVELQLGGRAYESSVARIDRGWVTLARPDGLDGVAARGAPRLGVTALPVTATFADGRVDGQVLDVSATGARMAVAQSAHFTVDSTFKLTFRSVAGTARIRRVDQADVAADGAGGELVYLGLTFEDDATELKRQLVRAMGGITYES
ncbi:MAG TPA: PilZ domain-containing protein [Ilumatobacter sp.]|nr:PilZ domain-containing protein [Ilumatobacter sp.]